MASVETWECAKVIFYKNGFTDFYKEYFIGKPQKFSSRNFIFRGLKQKEYELIPNFHRWFTKTGMYDKRFGKHGDIPLNQIIEYIAIDPRIAQKCLINEILLLCKFYQKCNKTGLHIPSNVNLDTFFSSYLMWVSELCEAVGNKWIPNDFLEFTALAQHYGIPTRMLDWTYDINVAAYFACHCNREDKEHDYAIYALNKRLINTIQYNQKMHNKEVMPLKIVTPRYSDNPNIYAQQGVLTTWQIDIDNSEESLGKYLNNVVNNRNSCIDKILQDYLATDDFEGMKREIEWGKILFYEKHEPLIYKFIFPKEDREETIDLLNRLNYTTGKLFPGFAGCANEIMENTKL